MEEEEVPEEDVHEKEEAPDQLQLSSPCEALMGMRENPFVETQ